MTPSTVGTALGRRCRMRFPSYHQQPEQSLPTRSQSPTGPDAHTPELCSETRAEGHAGGLTEGRRSLRTGVARYSEEHAAPGIERPSHLSRRRLLQHGSGAALGIATPWYLNSDVLAAAKKRKTVWGLQPCDKGCSRCRACQGHAANKLFPSSKAAERQRAHRNCRCEAVQIGTLTRARWTAMFVRPNGRRRHSVDRRWSWVRWLLNPLAQSHLDPVAAAGRRAR